MKKFKPKKRTVAYIIKCIAALPLSAALIAAVMMSPVSVGKTLPGDIDLDGKITSTDIDFIMKTATAQYPVIPDQRYEIADVNNDGRITAADAKLAAEKRTDGTVVMIRPELPDRIEADNDDVVVDTGNTIYGDATPVVGGINDYNLISNNKMYIYPDLSQAMNVRNAFVVVSFGWGHGVGMSQRGAVALAREGYSYVQIIQHYYGGVAIMKENYPKTVRCAGRDVDTVEMLARIIQIEIAGVTKQDSVDESALKAQAVAAYTNMKYSNYSVSGCSYVSSFSQCRSDVKRVAAEIAGQFIQYNGNVVYAYYSAVSAGVSATYEQVWGPTSADMSYLYNAASYYDCNTSDYVRAKVYTPEQMKAHIHSFDPSIELSADPSEWIKILVHDDAVNENIGYVSSMQIGSRTLKNAAGMTFRNNVMDYEVRSPCFAIIYNGKYL